MLAVCTKNGSAIYILEVNASNKLDAPGGFSQKTAVEQWCQAANEYTTSSNGKPWRYAMIPHDAIQPNMMLGELVKRFWVRIPLWAE